MEEDHVTPSTILGPSNIQLETFSSQPITRLSITSHQVQMKVETANTIITKLY